MSHCRYGVGAPVVGSGRNSRILDALQQAVSQLLRQIENTHQAEDEVWMSSPFTLGGLASVSVLGGKTDMQAGRANRRLALTEFITRELLALEARNPVVRTLPSTE